jgi:hypothetical protein
MRLLGWVLLFAGLLLLWPLLGPLVVGVVAVILLFPLLLSILALALVLVIPALLLALGLVAARVLLPFLLIGLGVWMLTSRRRAQAVAA